MTKRSRIQRLVKRVKQKRRIKTQLGVAVDPNLIIKKKSLKDEIKCRPDPDNSKITFNEKRLKLEEQANRPPAKRYRFGVQMSKFCSYLIAKYGEDYKAMEKDPKNYYQESAGSLKRMIAKFKSFKVNYNAFQLANKEIEKDVI